MIRTETIEIRTSGEGDIVNISDRVQEVVSESGVKEGAAILFVQSSTSSLTIMEFENGLLKDIPKSLERLAPKSAQYEHDKAWHDGNGHSHVRSAVIGVSLTVPFSGGELMLGTWQQIVLCEFDVRPRLRKIVVQLISE